MLTIGEPDTWSWETDGLARQIADATTVHVRRTEDGGVTVIESDVHVVVDGDGRVRWFTDCGDPKAGAT